jgi:L,D-transpeptidase YcbB
VTHRLAFILGILLVIAAPAVAPRPTAAVPGSAFLEQVPVRIRAQIAHRSGDSGFICRGELLCAIHLLPSLYEERDFRPAWLDAQGLRPMGHALVRHLHQSDQDGLRPDDYHLSAITSLVDALPTPALPLAADQVADWADLDLLLTDAYLLFSAHLFRGRVNPETLHNDWVLVDHPVDITAVLKTAVTEAQLEQVLDLLRPAHADYTGLRTALHTLRKVAEQGGWPQVPEGPTLRREDRHARVLPLRQRLHIGGDLPEVQMPGEPDRFDDRLHEAVLRFQRRHGLTPDGLVGQKTLQALNVPVQQRIRQVELNLERWRWLPSDLGRRYIVVNTADFSLRVVAHGTVAMQMRVVVGRPARRTPVFSAPLTHMVIHPQWTVPPTIAVEDILPRLVEDPGYLEQNGIALYHGWNADGMPIDPFAVDWRLYGKHRFPFRLVQAPGRLNPLGKIMFLFPNKFAVYLHDSPARDLFGRVQRDFSSGCIRVEDALSLARYLVKDDSDWSPARLQELIDSGRRQVVHVKRPLPVHLLYMTAWVDHDGGVQFREDIYGRDLALDQALEKRPSVKAMR